MEKTARVLCLGLLLAATLCAVAQATADIDPIATVTFPNVTFSVLTRLPDGGYLLGGAVPTGSQPWETRPSVTFFGSTGESSPYSLDGMDLTEVNQGTVASFEWIEETEMMPGGNTAEYGGRSLVAGILDYGVGGTRVVQVVMKSGTNEFSGADWCRAGPSLNDLTVACDGSLLGAGSGFDGETFPVLGYFDEAGKFHIIKTPVSGRNGFLRGIESTGTGLSAAYGQTFPDGTHPQPLLTISSDFSLKWEAPPNLPWVFGTIGTLKLIDTYLWWLGGETPAGAGFARTADGGATWTSQMLPHATYIWDLEIGMLPIEPWVCDETWILGAALGTYYLDDGSKESIVYRTLDGTTWEEMWRVEGYGGDLFFDYLGDGEIGIVQNGLDGTATFSRYAAHDFFGATNLICDMKITSGGAAASVDEPFTLQLEIYGPWGERILWDSPIWSTDRGELLADRDDPMVAILTTPEPGDVTVTCTEPTSARSVSAVFRVEPSSD